MDIEIDVRPVFIFHRIIELFRLEKTFKLIESKSICLNCRMVSKKSHNIFVGFFFNMHKLDTDRLSKCEIHLSALLKLLVPSTIFLIPLADCI